MSYGSYALVCAPRAAEPFDGDGDPMTDAQHTTAGEADAGTRAKAFAKSRRGPILGAIFLMATSAIGPGFITQTATFTAKLGAAFAFAILA